MNWIYGDERPELLTWVLNTGQRHYTVHVNIEEVDAYEGKYRWLEANLLPGEQIYGNIVSALVRAKYSQDEMEAALFNQIPEEIAEINQWRALCKEVAHEVLEEIDNEVQS